VAAKAFKAQEDGVYRLVPNDSPDPEDDYGYYEKIPNENLADFLNDLLDKLERQVTNVTS
jgi:hypothetical protein